MKKTIKCIVGITTLILFANASSTNAYILEDLIRSHGTISIGDKVFGEFGYFTSANLPPSLITVTASQVGCVYYLQFQGPMVSFNGALYDIGIQYSVTATAGKISMIDQAFNLTGGGGIVAIGETLFDQGFFIGNAVAQSTVSYNLPLIDIVDPPGEAFQGDNLYLSPPLQKVYVTKDIYLISQPGGSVGATMIVQSFHQNIPDGGLTFILLGAAFSCLGLLHWRTRKL